MKNKKPEKYTPHPDDFMVVTIHLAFQAKLNPDAADAIPVRSVEIEQTYKAEDAADYVDKVLCAIRERRLFGFTLQEQAESAVGAREWIGKTFEEILDEAIKAGVPIRAPNLQKITDL